MQTNMNFPTYVFATVNPGRSTQVVEELKRNSQIDIIASVTGRYDLVLRLKPNTPHNIYQTVKKSARSATYGQPTLTPASTACSRRRSSRARWPSAFLY